MIRSGPTAIHELRGMTPIARDLSGVANRNDLGRMNQGAKKTPAAKVSGRLTISGLWWAWMDSNQRPQSYQDCALTA